MNATTETRNCQLSDIRVARQIYMYAEINGDGTANLNTTDTVDAEDAFAEGYYEEFYECRNCNEEWHGSYPHKEARTEALDHLNPEQQAEIWGKAS